jgi:osmotically-inducible protein OsmY
MRDYNDQLEAAYMTSRRQGDRMRDREQEQSTHQNRQNRYLKDDLQRGTERYARDTGPHRQTMDSYRPADSAYSQVLDGNQRGKGPRNFKRSDERIMELVCDELCDNADLDASSIEVDVKDSEVILTGEVRERRPKTFG